MITYTYFIYHMYLFVNNVLGISLETRLITNNSSENLQWKHHAHLCSVRN